MKDLIYELASLTLGVAEYLLYDLEEGQTPPQRATQPSCRADATPSEARRKRSPRPAWTPRRDRHVYP